MSFFRKLFNKSTPSDPSISSYAEFWNWFVTNEQLFFKIIKNTDRKQIENSFFTPLSNSLSQLRDGYFFLTGMDTDSMAELVFTPDGALKMVVYVEELVAAAPSLPNWKFTALKPATSTEGFQLEMAGLKFSTDTIGFYANEDSKYPDEIDITLTYNQWDEKDSGMIANGIFLFLDNQLGELVNITALDEVQVIDAAKAEKDIIPIKKLSEYLKWREKEFIEKYEGVWYDTQADNYALFEGSTEDDQPVMALINTDLVNWDKKASHPWMLVLKITYDGSHFNGLPDEGARDVLDQLEDEIEAQMNVAQGELFLGRQTGNNRRLVYYALKDFRHATKLVDQTIAAYQEQFDLEYSLYKDKYWRTLAKFQEKNYL